MNVQSSSLMLLMSFAAGTFSSAGASDNTQHLMLASPSGGVPNNPLPLIIWLRVVPEEAEDIAAWFEKTFEQNGWPPAWRYPIFPYTHYHPNAHGLLAGFETLDRGAVSGGSPQTGFTCRRKHAISVWYFRTTLCGRI